MNKTYKDLPEWVFELDEISANVYKVIGMHNSGYEISAIGISLEDIIEQCKSDAKEIELSIEGTQPSSCKKLNRE